MYIHVVVSLFLIAASKPVACKTIDLVAPFDDSLLATRATQDGVLIPPLGRVNQLDSDYSLPTDVASKMSTKFTINSSGDEPSTRTIEMQTSGEHLFDLSELRASKFNATATKTVIMIAGYRTKDKCSWIENARDHWIKLEQYVNVIRVSWSDSNHGLYNKAVAMTPLIARQITILLYYLAAVNNVNFLDPNFAKRIHFIGHSLGAHIGGFVGQDLGGKMGRITGLDPAGPYFDTFESNDDRLDLSDALMVDVIHTNQGQMSYAKALAGLPLKALSNLLDLGDTAKPSNHSVAGDKLRPWYGSNRHLGHVDYYANDGKIQPGCSEITSDYVSRCDHRRATEIFTDILKYEATLKSIFKPDEFSLLRKSSRLLAFDAFAYESFKLGANLKEKCPSLMDTDQHLGLQAAQSIHMCTLPIDLLTPVDELRQEFIERYGINFGHETLDGLNSRQFYFKTSSARNFVGDHYLLKLYPSSFNEAEKFAWTKDKCLLDVSVQMAGDSSESRVDFTNIIATTPIESAGVIALPFVISKGAKLRWYLQQIFQSGFDLKTLESYQRDVLPDSVTLSLFEKSGIKSMIKGLFKSHETQCKIQFDSIEIHPVVERERNFAGFYEPMDGSSDEDSKGSFKLLGTSETKAKLSKIVA